MTASARESTVTARAGDWLLRSAPSHPQAMTEWEESGAAWLLPGVVQKALLPVPAPDVTSPIESGGPCGYRRSTVRLCCALRRAWWPSPHSAGTPLPT
ncbi:hypothetical protein DVH02_11400 [Streptomyces corynorhini]|uniref:Uncharacterized protein n=1 Tax=Streptomyces corynorhini TaxID=2282652 RepID=A0A370BBL6_9ACTN|nr:hypothetical protein DVH02_11400 [Streptomyces corynorhini]